MRAKLVNESINELFSKKEKPKEEKFYLDFDFNQPEFNKYTPKQKHLFGEVLYLFKKDARIKNFDVMRIAKKFEEITGKNLWDRLAVYAPDGNYEANVENLHKNIMNIFINKTGKI